MSIGIDIGLKYLAICAMSRDANILFWEVLNVLDSTETILNTATCSGVNTKGPCKCACRYIDNSTPIPYYSCKRHATQKSVCIKHKKIKTYSMQGITRHVIKCIDSLYVKHQETLSCANRISIELQPKVNNKMKFVSHLVFGKLVEYCGSANVVFVSARSKLGADGKNLTYHQRKQLAITKTRSMLKDSDNIKFFESNNKKSDLADAFLYAVNGLALI